MSNSAPPPSNTSGQPPPPPPTIDYSELPTKFDTPRGASLFPEHEDTKLNKAEDWLFWKTQFCEAVENAAGLVGLRILVGSLPKPPDTMKAELAVWGSIDSFLRIKIVMCVERAIGTKMINLESAALRYNFLSTQYGPEDTGSILIQFRKLCTPMTSTMSLKDYTDNFLDATNSLHSFGMEMGTEILAGLFIGNIYAEPSDPNSYFTWSQSVTLNSKSTLDEIISSAGSNERMRKAQKQVSQTSELVGIRSCHHLAA
ncbi:hypothetical protein CYLTODRAFT_460151 [Cylindrobasidium torrendii FP15055 ss-10]|uniref:Uncharacterized protein n=1 Tax=Cylindrobasidium torrendii FP15055 ss-10 TaxID=1314674 RepID=A0A0D7ASU5_9AGAR|nr:hypothetical protein CYLTODRAFT_460151 [Cylindrobasidium torrendii FP15055 ss-10]